MERGRELWRNRRETLNGYYQWHTVQFSSGDDVFTINIILSNNIMWYNLDK
jgi:hypothetical protein